MGRRTTGPPFHNVTCNYEQTYYVRDFSRINPAPNGGRCQLLAPPTRLFLRNQTSLAQLARRRNHILQTG
jgi:hypothetical protein